MNLDNALKRYVELISRIRLISAPEIGDIEGEEYYRNTLIKNFTEIGEMSKEVKVLLDDVIFPLLNSDEILTDEEEELLNDFSKVLVNTTTISYLDTMLCHKISIRLMENAQRKNDDRLLIRAHDRLIDSSYIMMALARRLASCSDLVYEYGAEGMEACMRLLEYLDKEAFAALPDDECKELVLVNSRFMNAIEFLSEEMEEEACEVMLKHLDDSLALGSDSFYAETAPNYDWKRHRHRIYQYFISCTEKNNICCLSKEQIDRIYTYYVKLEEMWKDDEEYCSSLVPRSTVDLYAARMNYLTGRIDAEEYKSRLRRIYEGVDPGDYGIHGIIANDYVLTEYLMVVRETGATEEDEACLSRYYRRFAAYLQKMPKAGSIVFATTFMCDILKNFVEVPDHNFADFCKNLVAAMHPPTYVHTLTMSSIVECLVEHLLRKKPELFVDFAKCATPEEVKKHEKEILSYAMQASQVHDVGKLFVIEFIMMYGRSLFEEEFQMIKKHPDIGAYVLRMHDLTKDHQAIAAGHHFRFEELDAKATEGLFDHSEIPFIAVASCADALDAATDTVGRSYKMSKSLEMVIDELRKDSGWIYAPYVVELFDDPQVVEDVRKILTEGREDNYRKTYEKVAELASFTE